MKQMADRDVFPFARVFAMVALLSTLFLANANPTFAASGGRKSPVAASISAVDHTEATIKQLQEALKITTSQEALWNNMTQVMRENAKEMDALTKDRSETTKTLNAVERLKYYSQITETHFNQQKKFIPVFEALYASMSDDQKKKTDALFQKGIMRKPKRK
jgi:hypothetical protein